MIREGAPRPRFSFSPYTSRSSGDGLAGQRLGSGIPTSHPRTSGLGSPPQFSEAGKYGPAAAAARRLVTMSFAIRLGARVPGRAVAAGGPAVEAAC
jgi:hypothetical protein